MKDIKTIKQELRNCRADVEALSRDCEDGGDLINQGWIEALEWVLIKESEL